LGFRTGGMTRSSPAFWRVRLAQTSTDRLMPRKTMILLTISLT
jgi:hypothetical protein